MDHAIVKGMGRHLCNNQFGIKLYYVNLITILIHIAKINI